ncbi:hypothetical protein SPRG_00931 [Saprolegnia parasitica CBS 223.65]|uniref:RanBP-type and C3HC4-type zinc finger-containing protein 1 n=1 Tax=Saprolegnia parasitica (strain CBS 223.65) TaxID=695850 RepID=A0A067D873_SAPPC|nr:hypothetical protein SPRG_00931 [Saprolegnia parasitica CBS 223.65]KDO34871.1 hypothetical protein SPRG_00931 [Saprolegnia parasitica CBS 223.65]|eukprot:XP_012194533.1 hypothetical protein SPRG_00931 [Saprolegnia parasitica CBS 223.65]
MEGFLRCQVCGDYMSGPVLLRNCRHCFCSECIRKHLLARGTGGNCPECKQDCSPGDLVPNRPLEQIINLFRALKPKVLRLADGAPLSEMANAPTTPTKTTQAKPGNSATKRVPVVSYNIMKDAEIRKHLEAAGLGSIRGTRDVLVATHKEYTMLCNAQLDTLHPKTPDEIRSQILATYKLRNSEKSQMASTKRSLGLRHDDPIEKAISSSPALNDNFRKLAEQIKAQKAAKKGQLPTAASGQEAPAKSIPTLPSPLPAALLSPTPGVTSHTSASPVQNAFYADTEEKPAHPVLQADGAPRYLARDPVKTLFHAPNTTGTWRQVFLDSTQQHVYVHTVTQEIRTDPPPSVAPAKSSMHAAAVPKSMTPIVAMKRPVEVAASTVQWACPRCTLVNEMHLDECLACGGPNSKKRPKRVVQKKLG